MGQALASSATLPTGETVRISLFVRSEVSMSRAKLQPEGTFPRAGLIRRFAAMFYDFMLCMALIMVVTWIYQQGVLRLIYGAEQLRSMAEAGAMDHDPILSSLVVLSLFAFFAKFWTHNGQTLGMQAWNLRIQNADGSRISLSQALLRFVISILSWLALGLGFWWMLFSKNKDTWHDTYSESQVIQLPKGAHKK